MKKCTLSILLLISGVSSPVFSHDLAGIQGAFSGQLRLGYTRTNDLDTTATGGKVGYETSFLNKNHTGKLKAAAVLYSTNPLGNSDDDDLFLDSKGGPNGKGYTLLGEAWVAGTLSEATLKLGRQIIDTPHADSDDVGMIPNTFSGALLTYEGLADTTFTAGYLDKAAGVDSSKEKFTHINGTSGVRMLGVEYEKDIWATQLWYYNQPQSTDMTYAEFSIEPNKRAELGLQLGQQRKQNVSGTAKVMGLSASYSIKQARVFADYNKVWGAYGVDNAVGGVGGGPYFTSAEQNTIDGVAGIRASAIGLEYNGFNKLVLGLRKVNFNHGVEDETDFTLSYQLGAKTSLDLIASDMGADGDNTRLFVNYDF